MTLYLVKHGSDDYRLHKQDGTEMSTWSSRPSPPEMAVGVSEHHGNPSKGKGGPPAFVKDDTRISIGDWEYHDLAGGRANLPWR